MRSLAILVLAILPSAALAQDPVTTDSTVHRHLGFFFRADIGVGYLSSSSGGARQLSSSGVSVPLGLAVGGAIAEDWILAGEIWGGFLPKSVNGVNQTLFVYGYSLAVVHYFMPANVYLSFAPGITRLTFETGNTAVSTDWGAGAKLAVGKEWWVGDHWGLGVAAEVFLTFNKDGGASRTTIAPGLTFTATFN
jgi:hypothetical protein